MLREDASNLQASFSPGRSPDRKEKSSVETQDVGPVTVPLSSLPPEFSFTKYLSPNLVNDRSHPTIVTLNEKTLDATYLVLLALNEECRGMRRGCFYYLPLRQDVTRGHPCDMVFIDEPWGEKSVKTWDASNWEKRLHTTLFTDNHVFIDDGAEGKINSHEHVMPVCSRILKFSEPAKPFGRPHVYASDSDPAVAKHLNVHTWSRPLMDTSRILILYMHRHAPPLIAHVHAIEGTSQCTTFPTPNDPSLTALPNWQPNTVDVFGRKSDCDAPRAMSSGGGGGARQQRRLAVMVTNKEVVLALLYIWNRGRDVPPIDHDNSGDLNLEVFDDWEADFGRTKVLWQELEDRIRSHSLGAHEAMLKYWPKE
ncbi:uncharacterized protein Z520_10770 [Fonsecaea multimorphosa CBS 102226]|uniref:Uncharacterized protein n=1 Tax=Fonsecaea multimorphosa CBS 102226 TaxID=1442371 RepID=A0A0D2JK20_9EURO|nr:uncharacterized protein Z520_10770 [Fonsecaea multimorphosa CBS 102226]KIX93592.1 hypothetical protein Z520_10770 [Fonsecaea multimorphosa CBS 102226]OAL18904.1 hypothetical protein AYO22_10233 [Fonsecaea multimorphosa]